MRYYNSYLEHDACNLRTSIMLNRFCVFGQKMCELAANGKDREWGRWGVGWQHACAMQTNMVALNFFSVVAPMSWLLFYILSKYVYCVHATSRCLEVYLSSAHMERALISNYNKPVCSSSTRVTFSEKYSVAQKVSHYKWSKNRIKVWQWDYIYSSN